MWWWVGLPLLGVSGGNLSRLLENSGARTRSVVNDLVDSGKRERILWTCLV
jgi:hypothetical protein